MLLPPVFNYGGRVDQRAAEQQLSRFRRSLIGQRLRVQPDQTAGRHTIKTGFYHQHALKRQNQGAPFGTLNSKTTPTTRSIRSFGFSNAALGIFSSFAQSSKFIEGTWIYNNTEFFIQDNWKVTDRLTLDYGVRFVHQQPQYRQHRAVG